MKRIGVVTGCRSEWGLLEPLVEELYFGKEFTVHVISVGPNNSIEHGITPDVPEYILTTIPTMLSSNTKEGIAKSIGVTVMSMAQFFASNSFDMLIILGDRWESLAVAIAAHTFQIPIMHLHAGEETFGSTDNAHRHAISHMATHLCAPTEDACSNLFRFFGLNKYAYHVGGLGMHKIDEVKTGKEYGVVIAMHPETIGGTGITSHKIFKAIERFNLFPFITTESPDVGFSTFNYRAFNVPRGEYLSILKGAKAIIGNSSSGIIEAPALETPTINVGDRQEGRPMGRSIYSVKDLRGVTKALKEIIDGPTLSTFDNFYGGKPVEKIVDLLRGELL